jgi:hypothetical protein
MKRFSRIASLALVTSAVALVLATTGTAAAAAAACAGQSTSQPFLRWLDPARYVLLPGGSLEGATGWTLTGGARLVAGNESFSVNSSKDRTSLSLPSGSSATSAPMCITLLHPDLRFFAQNTGTRTSTLKIEAVVTLAGVRVTLPVGLLLAGGSWQPTLPLPFLTNLVAPLSNTVTFRFTPLGSNSGWRIDDLYLDPYKSA